MITPQARAEALVERLSAVGDIRTEVWRRAFSEVPRHLFVPWAGVPEAGPQGSRYTVVGGADSEQRERWLELVYSDTTLITQLDGHPIEEAARGGSATGRATSSSTAPGLMAWMLETLDLRDGHTVLEVGTGSGYNAALLGHRLGDQNVTSIDVDADLVSRTVERLAAAGRHPRVQVGEARKGFPDNAPYDRIIATCSLPALPSPWIEQCQGSAKILANIAGPLTGAMVLADVADQVAEGRFLPRWAGFMWARPGFHAVRDITPRDTGEGAFTTRDTTLNPQVLDDRSFAFTAQLFLTDALPYWAAHDDGSAVTGLISPDGSWSEVVTPAEGTSAPRVDQGGERRLWDEVERAHAFWQHHGRPGWADYGLTATPESGHIWLRTPEAVVTPETWAGL
jgi:methyltransferase of ATP-grasp peptide maturase system